MDRLLSLNKWVAFVVFVILDVVCVAMGMGVPIFCIALGFPVGWYIATRALRSTSNVGTVFKRTVVQGTFTSAVTFAMMLVLWGPTAPMLGDPAADLANFGHPMILYEPKISFVGWLVLMIFISPFLQLLITLFASHVTLLVWMMRNPQSSQVHSPAVDPDGRSDGPEGEE